MHANISRFLALTEVFEVISVMIMSVRFPNELMLQKQIFDKVLAKEKLESVKTNINPVKQRIFLSIIIFTNNALDINERIIGRLI